MKSSVAICFLLAQAALVANPQSPALIAGDASFEIRSPEVLEIVASDRSVIEWSDFSIDSGETTRFIQPNASSSVLNRVILDNPSRLMGQLESNGQVLLINPNGILVGNEAQINTGSFIASSLDINQEMFLAKGQLQFYGDSEAFVQNEGAIQAEGDLFLIGSHVVNEGSLAADGPAGLLATRAVSLGGDKAVYVQTRWVDGDNPFAGAFKIEEPTFSRQSGVLSGNDLYVLGDVVYLDNGSLSDASGSNRGGNVFIGGDYQGSNPAILNSQQTWIAPEAKISANALTAGDGGRVIVWSDGGTEFAGTILAQGGPENGNGGFTEVSGKQGLNFTGLVNLLAPYGKVGQLLLDPPDITIHAGAGQTGVFSGCVPGPNTYTPGIAADTLGVTPLLAQLVNCDVTVLAATGTITLTGVLTVPNTSHNLTLTSGTAGVAGGGITINAAINFSGANSITINDNGGLASPRLQP